MQKLYDLGEKADKMGLFRRQVVDRFYPFHRSIELDFTDFSMLPTVDRHWMGGMVRDRIGSSNLPADSGTHFGALDIASFLKLGRGSKFLSFLDKSDLNDIFENAVFHNYQSGTNIIEQGDIGDSIYVVISGGAAAFFLDKRKNKRYLAKFGAGNFFGEAGYITTGIRNAFVETTGSSVILEVTAPRLEKLVRKYPEFYDFLYHKHMHRLGELDAQSKKFATRFRVHQRQLVEGEAKFHLAGVGAKSVEAQHGILKDVSLSGCKVEIDGNVLMSFREGLFKKDIPFNMKVDGMDVCVAGVVKVAWFEQAKGMDVLGFRYRIGFRFTKLLKGNEQLKKFCAETKEFKKEH